ncbi:MAG: hypothetical protein R3B81_04150 [bacterium]
MRTVRAVRARVPAESRAEYLELLARWQAACAESPRVKGFYVMESTETPGDFLEFLEFADEAAADAFGEELREAPHRAILDRLRELVPDVLVETSFWRQRL